MALLRKGGDIPDLPVLQGLAADERDWLWVRAMAEVGSSFAARLVGAVPVAALVLWMNSSHALPRGGVTRHELVLLTFVAVALALPAVVKVLVLRPLARRWLRQHGAAALQSRRGLLAAFPASPSQANPAEPTGYFPDWQDIPELRGMGLAKSDRWWRLAQESVHFRPKGAHVFVEWSVTFLLVVGVIWVLDSLPDVEVLKSLAIWGPLVAGAILLGLSTPWRRADHRLKQQQARKWLQANLAGRLAWEQACREQRLHRFDGLEAFDASRRGQDQGRV